MGIDSAKLFYFFLIIWNGLYAPSVLAHGALTEGESEGFGPLIFVPVIAVFCLFLIFANRKKGWSVLVIGGAGYIGSKLVMKLLDRGYRVTTLDTCNRDNGLDESYRLNLDFRQVEGRYEDTEELVKALEGCDSIIFVASKIDKDMDTRFIDGEVKFNSDDFQSLIKTADHLRIKKIIFTSSLSVYSNSDVSFITEAQYPEPSTEHSKSLLSCEKILLEGANENLDVCVVRPGSVLGPGVGSKLSGELNQIVSDVIFKNPNLKICGFKSYPFIHVDDLINLYLFLLDQPGIRIDRQIYNVGFGEIADYELKDILKAVLRKNILLSFSNTKHISKRQFSFEKLIDDLGFQPRHDAKKGVEDLVRKLEK